MRRRPLAVIAAALGIVAPAGALADECQVGWVAEIDVPREGSAAPPNTRFRVLEYMGCSSVVGGPKPAYRLLGPGGGEIPFHTEAWADHFVEIVPDSPLAEGAAYVLEVRRPETSDTLGPFQPMTRATIAGPPDTAAPSLAGLRSGETGAMEGYVSMSPCHMVPGWELKTRLTFAAASDAGRPHNDLLYLLERRSPGAAADAPWERVTTLRPQPEPNGMSFEWESEEGWGEAWVYRISARDMAGNHTVGLATVTVQNPARPARELYDPEAPFPSAATLPPAGRCDCRASPGAPGTGAGRDVAAIFALAIAALLRGWSRRA